MLMLTTKLLARASPRHGRTHAATAILYTRPRALSSKRLLANQKSSNSLHVSHNLVRKAFIRNISLRGTVSWFSSASGAASSRGAGGSLLKRNRKPKKAGKRARKRERVSSLGKSAASASNPEAEAGQKKQREEEEEGAERIPYVTDDRNMRVQWRPPSPVPPVPCEGCGHEHYYWLANTSLRLVPHFYCDTCSNVLHRSVDSVAVMQASIECDTMDDAWASKLSEETAKILPRCPCGGRFRPEAEPKCMKCKKEFVREGPPLSRYMDPHIIVLAGDGDPHAGPGNGAKFFSDVHDQIDEYGERAGDPSLHLSDSEDETMIEFAYGDLSDGRQGDNTKEDFQELIDIMIERDQYYKKGGPKPRKYPDKFKKRGVIKYEDFAQYDPDLEPWGLESDDDEIDHK